MNKKTLTEFVLGNAEIFQKVPVGWKNQKLDNLKNLVSSIISPAANDEKEITVEKTITPSGSANIGHNSSDVISPDPISNTVYEVENLTPHGAETAFFKLREEAEYGVFRLGGVIAVMVANGWSGSYESFKEYCEQHLGMSYRKAMYFAQIYNTLVELDIPWSKVQEAGWTKIREMLPVLTQENVDLWVQKAQGQTVLQLQESVKQALKPEGSDGGELEPVTTMTFKLHGDQKQIVDSAIEKAMTQLGTDVKTVAFEHICLDYAANSGAGISEEGEGVPDFKDPVQWMAEAGWEKTLEFFEKAFPAIELDVTVTED